MGILGFPSSYTLATRFGFGFTLRVIVSQAALHIIKIKLYLSFENHLTVSLRSIWLK